MQEILLQHGGFKLPVIKQPNGLLVCTFWGPENVFEGGHGIVTWHAQLTRHWQQKAVENKQSVGFGLCGVR